MLANLQSAEADARLASQGKNENSDWMKNSRFFPFLRLPLFPSAAGNACKSLPLERQSVTRKSNLKMVLCVAGAGGRRHLNAGEKLI